MTLDPPRIAETHVSWVALVGDRAYKLLKPVDLGFLDHRTRQARRRACAREVRINRRFAPDVYLGVLDVCDEGGRPRDHLIEMRRMPAARRLSRILAAPEAPARVREVARAVAAAHALAPSSGDIARAGEPGALRANWEQGFAQVREVAPGLIDAGELERVEDLVREYLAGRERLLRRRIAEGWIRDGHGDLLADDIYCLPDGPRLLDCLAFDDRLRHADVLSDVASLAMDLEARGAPGLAESLLGAWAERLGERHPPSLAHHLIAYRAHVRAKVACLRHAQGDEGAAGRATRLHALAQDHLERGRVRMVLVGGTPGTGKSTLAAGLAARTGWSVLRSDEVRDRVAVSATVPPGPAAYGEGRYLASRRRRVYRELIDAAVDRLGLGESVILDASWGAAADRRAAREAAATARAPVLELRCTVPREVAWRRIAARAQTGGDPSEATPEIASRMAAEADTWPRAAVVDTDGPPSRSVAAALRLVGPS